MIIGLRIMSITLVRQTNKYVIIIVCYHYSTPCHDDGAVGIRDYTVRLKQ